MKKRFIYVDALRGFCIILIIVFHSKFTVINRDVNLMLIHLRVPMFFVLSGLFFKRYGCFREFIMRKVNQLVVPYFFFAYIPFCLFSYFYTDRYADPLFYLGAAIKPWNYPLWFLRSLFLTYVFYYVFDKYTENRPKWLQTLIIAIIVTAGWYITLVVENLKPTHTTLKDCEFIIHDLHQSLKAMLYFFLAQQIKKKGWLDFHFNWTYTIILSVATLLLAYAFRQNRVILYSSGYVQHIVFAYISSFSFIFSLAVLFAKMKHTRMLEYFGKNSIIVLGCHYLIIIILNSNFIMPPYAVFLITFFLMFPCFLIFKKYFSKWIGHEEMFKSKV